MAFILRRRLVASVASLLLLASCGPQRPAPRNSGLQQAPGSGTTSRRVVAEAGEVIVTPPTEQASAGEDCPEPSESSSETGPGLDSPDRRPDLAEILLLHEKGRLDEALQAGQAVVDELSDRQLDSAELRFLLGAWAIEAGDGLLAEAHLAAALAALSGAGDLEERARVELKVARSLAYGADAVAMTEAETLFEEGAWAEADEALKRLFTIAEDEEVLQRGQELREVIYRDSVTRVDQHLARIDELLARVENWKDRSGAGGDGGDSVVGLNVGGEGEGEGEGEGVVSPYTEIQALLSAIEALPRDAWEAAEVARRRSLLAERVASSSDEARGVLERELEATLDEARALVAANRYREALALYMTLEGTDRESLAQGEASVVVDALVKEQRLLAGRLFVAARSESSVTARLVQLESVRDLLVGLLMDFPRSRYASKIAANLAKVEEELSKLDREVAP